MYNRGAFLFSCPHPAPPLWRIPRPCGTTLINYRKVVTIMKVVVRDNQIEKAIKDLKRKLTKEGFFSEIKERRFYDKPSVQKKKKQAKAAKRRRKRVKRF